MFTVISLVTGNKRPPTDDLIKKNTVRTYTMKYYLAIKMKGNSDVYYKP